MTEETEYWIHLREQLELGLKDEREGNVVDHEEVKRQFAKWLIK